MQRSELGSSTLVIWMVMLISSPSVLLSAFRLSGCGWDGAQNSPTVGGLGVGGIPTAPRWGMRAGSSGSPT